MTETKIEFTHPSSLAHIAMPDVVKIAAETMGLAIEDIMLTGYGCVQNTLTPPEPRLDEAGQPVPLTPADLFNYTYTTTWIPRVELEKAVEAVEEPKIPWPRVLLPRGARWHGMVQLTADTVSEVTLVSDGATLHLTNSPEGMAVLAEHQIAGAEGEGQAGSFGFVAPNADPA